MTNKKVIIDGVGWPQDEDRYWHLDDLGRVLSSTFYHARSTNESRRKEGNCFPTEQKAECERLRRECMATRWVPGREDDYWVIIINYTDLTVEINESVVFCDDEIAMGLVAPTKEKAQARWDKYGEAWLDALKT